MLRALCLAMTIFVLPLVPASADEGPNLGANAALKYWQAFAQLPKFTDAEQKKLVADCLTMPLDAHARELVTRADYALLMMYRGAALPRCNWAIGSEEGIRALLPHLQAARVLTSLACLRARIRFEEGRNAEAIEDIVAGMTVARHASHDGILIPVLVRYVTEQRMGEALALYLPKLSVGAIKDLQTRLDALPPGGSPASAMKFEDKFGMDWLVRDVRAAKDKESLLDFLGQLCGSPEKGRAFLEGCGGTVDGVLKFVEETRACYERMGTKLDLPLDQFEQEYNREVEKQAGNPVFTTLFPGLDRVRVAQARADVRRALLSAALAVQLDGPDALKNHPDPVGGGSFEYVAFDGGFELRSRWKMDEKLPSRWQLDTDFNKPPVLIVGLRGK
jgi:hypothetical protein